MRDVQDAQDVQELQDVTGGGDVATGAGTAVADELAPVVEHFFGARPPVRFEFWDGSSWGEGDTTIRFRSAEAIRRILWMPNELGLGRAYVAGDVDLDGDVFEAIVGLRDATAHLDGNPTWRLVPKVLGAARRLGLVGRPPPPPAQEAHVRGLRHSLRRDAEAISHHYDVGNDFYELVLGPSMTYSCARFVDDDVDLADAQASKHELVCRKLGLHEHAGATLLDVGCGWGSMAIHAATHHGARVVGITISEPQAERARDRVAAAGVAELVEIRLQDYRDLGGERFDAISSIGMSEHVGQRHLAVYFASLRSALSPHGRLLNHAISSVGGSKLGRTSFVGRYVFPDGELADVGDTVLEMERAGFEVRDVESLREHYARTLRAWVANLESRWDEAVRLVGEPRAKIWRLYMAGSAVGFEDGGISIHQVLGVVPDDAGGAAMPRTRDGWGGDR